ncbi:hypothetical protein V8F33_007102 [Rhypophila sp. PSN 637]
MPVRPSKPSPTLIRPRPPKPQPDVPAPDYIPLRPLRPSKSLPTPIRPRPDPIVHMPLRPSKSLPTLIRPRPPQPQPEPPGPIVPAPDYMPPRPSESSLTPLRSQSSETSLSPLWPPSPHIPSIYARLCPPSAPPPPPSLSSGETDMTVVVEDPFNKLVRAFERLADEILVAMTDVTRALDECAKASGQVPIAVSSLAPGPRRLHECSKPSAGVPVVVEDSFNKRVRACRRLADEILVAVTDATRALNGDARPSGQGPITVSSPAPGPTEESTEVNEQSPAELTRLADDIMLIVADVTHALNEYARASGQAPIVVWSPAPGPTEESTGASDVNRQPAARSSEMRGNESAEIEIAPVEEPKAILKAPFTFDSTPRPWVLRLHPYSPGNWVGRRRKRVVFKKVRRDLKETTRRARLCRKRREDPSGISLPPSMPLIHRVGWPDIPKNEPPRPSSPKSLSFLS